MPISIYPPTLQSTQSAFIYTTNSYLVYFSLQKITSFNDIGHIQIRVVKQSNNRSIVNTTLYPDGTIYKSPSSVLTEGNQYAVAILANDLAEKWQPGYLYKIQMRFGINEKYTNVSDFATWKQLQIDQNAFSEWSTVMVVKAISEPDIYIKNAEAIKPDVIQTERTESTLTPLFSGYCRFSEENSEAVDKYKFILYSGSSPLDENLLENSGWLQHNSLVDSIDQYRFKTVLEATKNYTVIYEIQSVNGYKSSSDPYTFLVSQNYLTQLEGITLIGEDSVPYCSENGCINLYLSSTTELSGNFIIARSSEFSKYAVWEDLSYLIYNKHKFDNELIFQDFTIESGIKYKYSIQQENNAGLRTSPTYEKDKDIRCVNFEYSFLYHNGVQLKLKFNQKISSFKHTTLSSKQDTLGDKYPHLTKNGYAYYAEFPISGLISFHMDEDQTFFTINESGCWYNGELIIPSDKIMDGEDFIFNLDLTHDNIYVERRFREKVEEFLNNFDYKLYKSPTEGNIVIVLQNVSLTPNATLGRMIFDFSATAYEVMENTIENLNEFGIIDIGQFESLSNDEISYSFGQISGLFNSREELFDLIKQQEEVSIGGGYKTTIKKISSLWIEAYPQLKFKNELLELEAIRADLAGKGEPTDEVDQQIAELTELVSALTSSPQSIPTVLLIDGKDIIMAANKVYTLDSIEEQITSIQLKYKQPIIINYKCQLTQTEDESVGVVSSIDASRIWGQISGIFTGTDKILKSYDYQYQFSKGYRIYNTYPDSTVIKDKYGNIILDSTLINLYKTVNLFDVIKEETRKQVEIIYELPNGFTNYNSSTDTWDDGIIYYTFSDIILFDIEADPGTVLYIGKTKDGSDKTQVTIGPTGRYTLNPMENLVQFIALKDPQFAIINYKCLTNQMKMTKQGE